MIGLYLNIGLSEKMEETESNLRRKKTNQCFRHKKHRNTNNYHKRLKTLQPWRNLRGLSTKKIYSFTFGSDGRYLLGWYHTSRDYIWMHVLHVL